MLVAVPKMMCSFAKKYKVFFIAFTLVLSPSLSHALGSAPQVLPSTPIPSSANDDQISYQEKLIFLQEKMGPIPRNERHRKLIEEFKNDFVDIPGVTQADVDDIWEHIRSIGHSRAYERTRIESPFPAFRMMKYDVSVGLYVAIMGKYPQIYGAPYPFHPLKVDTAFEVIQRWEKDDQLPVEYLKVPEIREFILKAREELKRDLALPSAAQDEYAARGRVLNPDGSFGPITKTVFYFGDDPSGVNLREWTKDNSEGRPHGVQEVVNPALLDHPFGLVNILGNVGKIAEDESYRGTSYFDTSWFARIYRINEGSKGFYTPYRHGGGSFRLIEKLPLAQL